jgi:hypothetical protein
MQGGIVMIRPAALLAATVYLLVSSPAVIAAGCAAPEDCVKQIYAPYLKANPRGHDPVQLFDEDLRKLWARAKSLEGDFFIQGQDYKLSGLRIGKAQIKDDRARVPVEFKNFDTKNRLSYEFVRRGDTWFVSEIKAGKESFRKYLRQGR